MNGKELAILVAMLALAPMGAQAQGTSSAHRWYAGVEYGQSHFVRDAYMGNVVDRDYHSDTFAIRIGYRFSRYFSVETGYIDVGDFSASYGPNDCPSCQPYDSNISIDGFQLIAIGTWPIAAHFQIRGAFGATWREMETTIIYPTMTNGWSDRDVIFGFGAGVGIPINERFDVDLAYTHYREIGPAMTLNADLGVINEAEASLITLGLRFRF